MFSARIGKLLRDARRHLDLSREELARRGEVSVRLVAELERGQRPNVSLESALKLLDVVGVAIVAQAPNGATAEIRSEAAVALARAARAARRRRTWTGRHVLLHDEGSDPAPGRSKAKRLASVARVSRQSQSMAFAPRGRAGRKPPARSGR